MSRWFFALVGIGCAIASAQAQPRPLWEIDTFPDPKGYHPVRWLGFTPDGKTLAAQVVEKDDLGVSDCRLIAWDAATRKEALTHKLGKCGYAGAAMRANAATKLGTVLVAGASPEEIRLADGAAVVAKGLQKHPVGVWFDGNGSACLWLMKLGEGDYGFAYGKMPPLAPDPKKAGDGEAWLAAKLPGSWDEDFPIVASNSDLTRLAVASRETRKLTLYNITTAGALKLTEVASVRDGHNASISSLRFSPDGNTLATGGWDTNVCLWDVTKAGKDRKPRATISAGNWTVVSLAFSPDGRTLAAGTTGDAKWPNLYIIDLNAGKALASYRVGNAVMSVAYSPDGKVLVTGDSLGSIKAWEAEALRNP